jgi:hypothetical protein
MPRTGGDDQVIEGDRRSVIEFDGVLRGVETDDLAKNDLDVLCVMKNATNRVCDLAGA